MKEESYLLVELKKGNKEAFTLLFHKYYKDLVLFGGNFLRDKVRCEDIVQNLFLKIWTDREEIYIESSLKSFMLRSVQNSCLDELRHRQVMHQHEIYTMAFAEADALDTENYILYSDLHGHLEEALKRLPTTYREAFEMNRVDGLKYREIAEKLHVSERTIEVRIGKALSLLRNHLKDFFVILVLLWCFDNILK